MLLVSERMPHVCGNVVGVDHFHHGLGQFPPWTGWFVYVMKVYTIFWVGVDLLEMVMSGSDYWHCVCHH